MGLTLSMVTSPTLTPDPADYNFRNNILSSKFSLPESPRYSESVQDLLKLLLDPAEAMRPTIQEIFSHPWINSKQEVTENPKL